MSDIEKCDVKQAVQAATKALKEFYPGKELTGLELEEVELSEGGNYWLITLGFHSPVQPTAQDPLGLLAPKYERKYKQFRIRASDATVEAMKIRQA